MSRFLLAAFLCFVTPAQVLSMTIDVNGDPPDYCFIFCDFTDGFRWEIVANDINGDGALAATEVVSFNPQFGGGAVRFLEQTTVSSSNYNNYDAYFITDGGFTDLWAVNSSLMYNYETLSFLGNISFVELYKSISGELYMEIAFHLFFEEGRWFVADGGGADSIGSIASVVVRFTEFPGSVVPLPGTALMVLTASAALGLLAWRHRVARSV